MPEPNDSFSWGSDVGIAGYPSSCMSLGSVGIRRVQREFADRFVPASTCLAGYTREWSKERSPEQQRPAPHSKSNVFISFPKLDLLVDINGTL